MDDEPGINELLRLENELQGNAPSVWDKLFECVSIREPPSLERDAKVNLLKFLQVKTVDKYKRAYDNLYYELNKQGGLECLRRIEPAPAKSSLLQPIVLEEQRCDADGEFASQLQFYRKGAECAKEQLDELVQEVINGREGCEGVYPKIKTLESTKRKAVRFYGGNVRRVADMARAAVICNTPEDLETAYIGLMARIEPHDVKRVTNGFDSDWMPNGYRDVKLNPVVNGHLCEIQLQLRSFFNLKAGQHVVYEWARKLKVTTETEANHLIKILSREVTQEMIRLAEQNWRGTGEYLPHIQLDAAQYGQAEEAFRQRLCQVEDERRGIADQTSNEWRENLQDEAWARNNLGFTLERQGKNDEAEALYRRSITIDEKLYGSNHPEIATDLNNLACFLKSQGKHDDAEPLFERSQAIREKALGREHPDVATSLNNRASLMELQARRFRT
ncbi:unnamed protein product [Ectocarpus sp. 6 AP-2014]